MYEDEKTQQNLYAFKPQLEKMSKKGVALVVFLLLVMGFGMYALYIQIVDGHIVTGMRDNVVWGLYIVNFIFFIGISYAGALISGILHLLRVPWRTPIIRMAEMITVISTMIGPAYILLCIGRLDRLPNLILFGRIQSPIIWDVIAISTYLSGSIIFLYLAMIRDLAILRDNPVKTARWRNPIYRFMAVRYKDSTKQKELLNVSTDLLSIVIIPLAILVHSVLAWIFGMTLRPGWHSTIFAPYFVIAAVYSGTGVLIMVMWVFRKVYHLESHITKIHFNYLGIIMIVLGAMYGYFTFSEYLTSWYGSIKWDMEVLFRLFNPSEYWHLFVFAVFIGVLVPIIIVTVPKFRNINSIAFAACIAVLALWVKRYLIIIPTLETPMLPIHDLRPEYVHYSATWVEWALTFAGIALFILLFYLFSKFIPIIPVVRSGEEKDYSRLRKIVFEKQMKKVIRQRKKSDVVVTGIIILLMIASTPRVIAQEEGPVQTVLKLEYFHIDSVQNLKATLRAKIDGRYMPLPGMEIGCKVLQGKTETPLGTNTTNDKGIATFAIPDEIIASGGDKGFYSFEASFSGKDNYDKALARTTMKPLRMEMSFFQKEGEKMVNLKAFEPGKNNEWIPVENLDVQFYVPRTFSLLKVGQAAITNGSASLEFPTSIPGNQLGYLTLVAKVEENDNYGNVEVSGTINWGKPLPPTKIIKRGLGDTDAPLWMVYTLIVLLSLVWFHYMYVIFTVFRIRHLGKT
ncbi:MAG: polysulfide reductase NrfD [Bacteroidales bacterium]|jgi:molybdopterin-containing oxidoreductase family membrane subunit|nr:polysulfide reductase NrfD [Bacteroidales bacterium]